MRINETKLRNTIARLLIEANHQGSVQSAAALIQGNIIGDQQQILGIIRTGQVIPISGVDFAVFDVNNPKAQQVYYNNLLEAGTEIGSIFELILDSVPGVNTEILNLLGQSGITLPSAEVKNTNDIIINNSPFADLAVGTSAKNVEEFVNPDNKNIKPVVDSANKTVMLEIEVAMLSAKASTSSARDKEGAYGSFKKDAYQASEIKMYTAIGLAQQICNNFIKVNKEKVEPSTGKTYGALTSDHKFKVSMILGGVSFVPTSYLNPQIPSVIEAVGKISKFLQAKFDNPAKTLGKGESDLGAQKIGNLGPWLEAVTKIAETSYADQASLYYEVFELLMELANATGSDVASGSADPSDISASALNKIIDGIKAGILDMIPVLGGVTLTYLDAPFVFDVQTKGAQAVTDQTSDSSVKVQKTQINNLYKQAQKNLKNTLDVFAKLLTSLSEVFEMNRNFRVMAIKNMTEEAYNVAINSVLDIKREDRRQSQLDKLERKRQPKNLNAFGSGPRIPTKPQPTQSQLDNLKQTPVSSRQRTRAKDLRARQRAQLTGTDAFRPGEGLSEGTGRIKLDIQEFLEFEKQIPAVIEEWVQNYLQSLNNSPPLTKLFYMLSIQEEGLKNAIDEATKDLRPVDDPDADKKINATIKKSIMKATKDARKKYLKDINQEFADIAVAAIGYDKNSEEGKYLHEVIKEAYDVVVDGSGLKIQIKKFEDITKGAIKPGPAQKVGSKSALAKFLNVFSLINTNQIPESVLASTKDAITQLAGQSVDDIPLGRSGPGLATLITNLNDTINNVAAGAGSKEDYGLGNIKNQGFLLYYGTLKDYASLGDTALEAFLSRALVGQSSIQKEFKELNKQTLITIRAEAQKQVDDAAARNPGTSEYVANLLNDLELQLNNAAAGGASEADIDSALEAFLANRRPKNESVIIETSGIVDGESFLRQAVSDITNAGKITQQTLSLSDQLDQEALDLLQGYSEFLSNYNFEEVNESKLYKSIIRKLLAASKKRR